MERGELLSTARKRDVSGCNFMYATGKPTLRKIRERERAPAVVAQVRILCSIEIAFGANNT